MNFKSSYPPKPPFFLEAAAKLAFAPLFPILSLAPPESEKKVNSISPIESLKKIQKHLHSFKCLQYTHDIHLLRKKIHRMKINCLFKIFMMASSSPDEVLSRMDKFSIDLGLRDTQFLFYYQIDLIKIKKAKWNKVRILLFWKLISTKPLNFDQCLSNTVVII